MLNNSSAHPHPKSLPKDENMPTAAAHQPSVKSAARFTLAEAP